MPTSRPRPTTSSASSIRRRRTSSAAPSRNTFPNRVYKASTVARDQAIAYFDSIGLNHELFSPVGTDAFNFNAAGIPASGLLTGQDCCKTPARGRPVRRLPRQLRGQRPELRRRMRRQPVPVVRQPQQQRPERAHVHVEGVRQHGRPDGVRHEGDVGEQQRRLQEEAADRRGSWSALGRALGRCVWRRPPGRRHRAVASGQSSASNNYGRAWTGTAIVAASIAVAASSSAAAGCRSGVSGEVGARVHAVHVIGYSVDRRPIVAILIASGRATRSMLVVGSIAGDEPGSTTVTRALESLPAVRGLRLWLIPNMNPDGVVRGTRVNADGVDLNRNFPFAWRPFSDRDSRYFPGRRPAFGAGVAGGRSIHHPPATRPHDLASPALRSDRRLARATWAEQLLSRATGLPLARLNDYPGSAIGWEDHLIPRSAFDLELPGPPLTPRRIRRYVDAIRLLARTYATRR